ncbi:MAG TPA: chemotaxis protein CheX [Firmicutes bacterium]|nr:chemotaxis protein CheX [Bacillota bacterium]
MKVEFVNPFLSAAFHVLETEVQAKIDRGDLSIEESQFTSKDITVMIGVVGKVRGIVMYSMSEETAKKLVSVMLGQPVETFDSMAESAISEIGNVITGGASAELEKAGYACRISPPTLIMGAKTVISTINIKRLVVPLKTQYGEIEVSIALEEAKSNPSADLMKSTVQIRDAVSAIAH